MACKSNDKIISSTPIFYTTSAVSAWQGIRYIKHNQYMIVGTSAPDTGILYFGPLDGSSISVYKVMYPNSTSTSVYGPDFISNDLIRLVGSYKTGDDTVNGFIFEGSLDDLNDPTKYTTVPSTSKFNYVHSVMGDLAVGNSGDIGLILSSQAFIYNLKTKEKQSIVYPESLTTTAYGIWYNGGTSYTICGGYAGKLFGINDIYVDRGHGLRPYPIGHGYVVNYDSKCGEFTNWTSFDYPNNNILTHFQGISSSKPGEYEISADYLGLDITLHALYLKIKKSKHRYHYNVKYWSELKYPNGTALISANSIANKNIVGIVFTNNTIIPYQAELLF